MEAGWRAGAHLYPPRPFQRLVVEIRHVVSMGPWRKHPHDAPNLGCIQFASAPLYSEPRARVSCLALCPPLRATRAGAFQGARGGRLLPCQRSAALWVWSRLLSKATLFPQQQCNAEQIRAMRKGGEKVENGSDLKTLIYRLRKQGINTYFQKHWIFTPCYLWICATV